MGSTDMPRRPRGPRAVGRTQLRAQIRRRIDTSHLSVIDEPVPLHGDSSAQHDPSVGDAVLKVISTVAGVATLVGGGLYALLWFSYARYYETFGLQPSDVGLGASDIVRLTAAGMALFIAVAIPTLVGWWLLSGLLVTLATWIAGQLALPNVREATRFGRMAQRLLDRRTVAVIGGAVLLPVVARQFDFNDFIFHAPYLKYAGGAVAAIVTAALASALPGHAAWDRNATTLAVWVAAAGIVFYCSALGLSHRAGYLAADLLDNGRMDSASFFFLIRADAVCVGPPGSAHFYRLLGSGPQGDMLFDTSTGTVVRLAHQGRTEFVEEDTTKCPG